jgi:hypothetical protein
VPLPALDIRRPHPPEVIAHVAAPGEVLPVVRGFADMWPTLSVGVRRDVTGALLTLVRVCQDKTVEIPARW